jgi:RNA polymerase sigma-70 factor (ECF subfamily)
MSEQDTSLWSAPMIREAEHVLSEAARQQRPGRYQLEAALQSAHIEGTLTGRPDWHAIAVLYEGLVRTAPTVGAFLGRAAALAEARGPAAGLVGLEEIDDNTARMYQPYWAVRGHLFSRAGRVREALEAYDRAIDLTDDPAIREFLHRRRLQVNVT